MYKYISINIITQPFIYEFPYYLTKCAHLQIVNYYRERMRFRRVILCLVYVILCF